MSPKQSRSGHVRQAHRRAEYPFGITQPALLAIKFELPPTNPAPRRLQMNACNDTQHTRLLLCLSARKA